MIFGSNRFRPTLHIARLVAAASLILLSAACVTTDRAAFTAADEATATPLGIANVRSWADDAKAMRVGVQKVAFVHKSVAPSFLALSGGGAQGAYGAGFLTCWSGTGTRPEFGIVSGSSVGALIAPFAFLGRQYDPALVKMFTSGEASNLMKSGGIFGLFRSGLFDSGPLKQLVDSYVDQPLLDAIAAQYARGRMLMAVTTDLDAQRTAIWDMGAIAASRSPGALDLFRTVLLASASIPGVYPPVMIKAQSNGRQFAEMHVDGSVTSNVLVVPEAMFGTAGPILSGPRPQIYVIINGKIGPEFAMTDGGVLPILQRSYATMLKSNTRNSLLASYEYAQRQGWDLKTTSIPDNFNAQPPTDFSTAAMRSLFAVGCKVAEAPQRWGGGITH